VFKNRVVKRIFGAKREELEGSWRGLHSEELYNLYASPNIIRVMKSLKMRWMGHVARMRNMKNAYKILVGISEGKRPRGSPRRKWEDNILEWTLGK
jgi:hypothetical protein